MSHNFKTLHEANEFIQKHGREALLPGDAKRILELGDSEQSTRIVEIVESDPAAVRRQIKTVEESIGPIRRLNIAESERWRRINAAEQEIKRLEKKLTANSDKEFKENLIAAGFSEEAADVVISEGDDDAFNSFKRDALRQGKTEEQATRYAQICCGSEIGISNDPSRADANYNNFLFGG